MTVANKILQWAREIYFYIHMGEGSTSCARSWRPRQNWKKAPSKRI